MCVTVWVLRYKNKKNGDRGTIVFTATLREKSQHSRKQKSLKTQVQQDKKKVRAGKPLKGSRAHRSNSEAEPQTKYTLGVPLRIKNKSEEEAILPPLWSRGVFIVGFPADQTKPTQYPGGVSRALQIKSKYVCSDLDLALSLELRC